MIKPNRKNAVVYLYRRLVEFCDNEGVSMHELKSESHKPRLVYLRVKFVHSVNHVFNKSKIMKSINRHPSMHNYYTEKYVIPKGEKSLWQNEATNLCIVHALRLDEEHQMMVLNKLTQNLSEENKSKIIHKLIHYLIHE